VSPGVGPSGAILFDFDGTLVDTREASWELFAETNSRFGLGVDTRDAFFDIFQGNFHRNFDALSDDKELIGQAKPTSRPPCGIATSPGSSPEWSTSSRP